MHTLQRREREAGLGQFDLRWRSCGFPHATPTGDARCPTALAWCTPTTACRRSSCALPHPRRHATDPLTFVLAPAGVVVSGCPRHPRRT